MFFFPVQLLLLHLKKNHLTLLCWALFFGYITESVGLKYGVPYVFLYPEYFGTANIWSFLLLGFALGGFITAFNLFTYTSHAYRFPFVATLARPFLKFNLNNSLIPAAFVLTYLWYSGKLQLEKELVPPGTVALHLFAFLLGIGLFLMIALFYFTRTNIDIHKMLGKDADAFRPAEVMEDIIPRVPPVRQQQRKATRWLRREQYLHKWRVDSYLTWPFRLTLARSSAHYDKDLLRSVLWQNHINGSIFEVAVVVTFIALGAFSNTAFFAIPAGASIFLLFTMLLMLFSALLSWMKGWMVTFLLGLVIVLNIFSQFTQSFLADAQAYGLDYKAPPAKYDREHLHALATDTIAAKADADAYLPVLQEWLKHNRSLQQAGAKPQLIIINTSGGGSRAMLWTFRCLQVADSILGGQLMERSALMTGSSGGLIGATYYRQLVLAEGDGRHAPPSAPVHLDEMASDILNPITFSLVTNDMFIRYRRVKDGDRSYTLDRGYAFERRMDSLTEGLLDIRIGDMAQAEREAKVPMLVISPTSANDGRRLLIAAQPIAYLANIQPTFPVTSMVEAESIEFQKLFKGQDPNNLKLSSALRMNASFPYITPVVSLPSKPKMRLMDAGARDNYGYRTTMMFLYTYREWLKENTSGVTILQMRDMQRELDVKPVGRSLFGRLLDPVGSIYDNFVRSQDQDYDLMVKQASAWMTVPLHMVDLQLRHADEDEISLSWHLTAVEKKHVIETAKAPDNKAAFALLKTLVLGNDTVNGKPQNDTLASPPSDPAAPR
ncbi:MAG: hypothetical protein ABI373_00765 [Flavobacteriales bacterium]